MLKKFFKKITGLQALEDARAKAVAAKMTPKQIATEKKEPWVAVLETHVNAENPRNGFFELDWNEYFIVQLRIAGYTGDNDEEVVDAWFRDLARNMLGEEGVSTDRFSGLVDVKKITGGRAEVS